MKKNLIVDNYLSKKDHPLQKEIDRVREIILNVDPKIEETIKWSSPTFMYKGNMASFFMNAKKHVSLMFHKGVLIENKDGLLTGEGKETRMAKFCDLEEIENKKVALENVVKAWIRLRDQN